MNTYVYELLQEARKVTSIILIFNTFVYTFTTLLLAGKSFSNFSHFISFVHNYFYFPTVLFLGLYIGLSGFLISKNSTQAKSFVLGGISTIMGLLLIIFLY